MSRRTAKQIWGAPVALGLLSVVGLMVALVADGAGDAVSWIALGIPALLGAVLPLRPSRR